MGFHAKDSTITFNWGLEPSDSALVKTDFDITLVLPDGTTTYVNDGITTYVAPTATSKGLATYDLTLALTGRYQVTLSVGTSAAHTLRAHREVYSVVPPAYILSAASGNDPGAPKTTQGPEIIPSPPDIPSAGPGTFSLEDIAYLDIAAVSSAELSGNTTNGIITGFYTTNYLLDASSPSKAVPISWDDFSQYSSIREAMEHATTENIRWGFLNVPSVPGENDPYAFVHNEAPNSGEFDTTLQHVFQGESLTTTFWHVKFAQGLADTTLPFMFSAEGGSGAGIFTEWNVTANDNDRFGFALVGTPLPNVSANWTNLNSNLHTVATSIIQDMASDGTNLYAASGGSEILKSTDDGVTFTDVFTLGGTHTFTKIIANASVVVAFDSNEVLFTSSDSGSTWTDRGAVFGAGLIFNLIYFDDTTDYFIAAGQFVGVYKLFRSTDGITWVEFGASIADNPRKAYPVVGDVGSGPEIFLYNGDTVINRLGPLDATETLYQSPPTATDMESLYVESGLTVYYDATNGVTAYNGTTEFSHSVYHDVVMTFSGFRKEGTTIFVPYLNVVMYGTSAEWLTTNGMNYSKQPTAYDDAALAGSNKAILHKGNWLYVYRFKSTIYSNPTGI